MHAQVKELLQTQPFRPFTVTMSNGSKHEIRHPENALLSKHFLFVVDADRGEPIHHLYLLHVAELQTTAAAPSN